MARRLRVAIASVILLAAASALLSACASDSERSLRQREADRERGIAEMRDATRATARGKPLTGESLRAEISGRQHEFAFGSFPDGKPGDYRVYHYYRSDGRLIYRDDWIAKEEEGRPGDRWWIDGERLCLEAEAYGPSPRCYTIATKPDGSVQYFVSEPGDPSDGLLTLETRNVEIAPPASHGGRAAAN